VNKLFQIVLTPPVPCFKLNYNLFHVIIYSFLCMCMFLLPLINESESRTKGNLVYIEDVFTMNKQSHVNTFKLSTENIFSENVN